jgi:hypothetical protein
MPADLKREADHEKLVRVFPVVGETIEPNKTYAGAKSRRRLGSPISIAPIRYHSLRLRPPRRSPTFPQKSVPSQVAKSEGATAANYGSALILIPGGNEQSPS